MIEPLNDTLDKVAVVGHGFEAIERVAKWALDDEKRDSYEALHTIATMLETMRGMFTGKISAEDTAEEINTLVHTTIGVDAKFDQSGDDK